MHKQYLPSIPDCVAETKICYERDHMHKNPLVDILHFTLGGRWLAVESERGSFIYRVFIEGELVREQITGAQLDAYLEGLQA